MTTELGGKGNPRILKRFHHIWNDDGYHTATAMYTVTLWSYTVEVSTRAEAAQLLHAISHISSRKEK